MNIVLIGMSGAGKTSVGKLLASYTGMTFSDTDEAVQTQHGDISKIFEIMGREKFRLWEKEAIKSESARKNCVIATGGGAVLEEENIFHLKAGGKIVYLRASAETLIARLNGSEDRPLLKGNLEQNICALLIKRQEIYEGAADLIVDTDKLTIEETAREIIRRMEG